MYYSIGKYESSGESESSNIPNNSNPKEKEGINFHKIMAIGGAIAIITGWLLSKSIPDHWIDPGMV
jgi:hypothetical protein